MFGVESGAVRQAPWHPRSASNRFTFNGKEAQTVGADFANGGSSDGGSGAWSALGSLPLLDYGARMLMLRGFPQFTGPDPSAEVAPNWGTYAFCFANPVRYRDPDGKFPIETIWDVGNVLYNTGAAIVNHIKGDHEAAKSNWTDVGWDAAAMLIPYVPAGASKAIRAANKAVDAATDAKKATNIAENAAKGKAFEKQVGESLGNNKASQVTIEAADGTKTRVDFVRKSEGKITLTEAKGSKTAPLTGNQKVAHPQIEIGGGTVWGNKGAEIGLPAGTTIPPTKVDIVRPDNLLNK